MSRQKRSKRQLLTSTALLALVMYTAPSAAVAQTIGGFEDVADMAHDIIAGLWPDDWGVEGLTARVGGGVLYAPAYRGASYSEWTPAPIIYLQYKNIVTFTGQKLKVRAYRGDHWSMGGFVRYRFGRKERNHEVLQGLGNIGDTWEIGPFVEYRRGHARITFELRPALNGGQGVTSYLEGSMGLFKNERWRVQSLAYVLWGSKKSLRTQFGISEEQSAASGFGLPVYVPNSGLVETRLAIGAEYSLTEKVKIGQFVSYGWLIDEAGASPIVQAGSKDQFAAGIGLIFNY